MIRKKIYSTVIIIFCLIVITGCAVETKTKLQVTEAGDVSYKQDMVTQALEHAQQMQLAAIKAQDENAVLRAKNEELTKQLEALQGGEEIEKPEPESVTEEPLNPDDIEQNYKKLQNENEELRKLIKYERELREDLMKKINEDQAIIKELKSKLGE